MVNHLAIENVSCFSSNDLIKLLKKRMEKGVVMLTDFENNDGSTSKWEDYIALKVRFGLRHGGCLLWSEINSKTKYGIVQNPWRFIANVKKPSSQIQTHRIIWSVVNQIDLADLHNKFVIRHLCHNPDCIQPHHLQLGTYYENSRDSRMNKDGYCQTPHKVC